MAKKFLTLDVETGKKQLSTAIVDKEYEGAKQEVTYSANAIDDFLSGIDGDLTLSEEFKVTGVNVGNLADGKTFGPGTSVLEILKQMLQKQIPPSYTKPSASLTATGSGDVEVGTKVRPTVTAKFNKNDAGDITKYTLRKNGMQVLDVASLQEYLEENDIIIEDGTSLYFDATINYDDGPIKNDNFGEPYPSTSIKAGNVSTGRVNYNGRRKLFWGTDASEDVNFDSNKVRALANNKMNPSTNTTFTINIKAGEKRAVFAYPATLRDVSSVKYVELGNGEVKDTFTQYKVQVAGANDHAPIEYKVYVYVAAVPAGAAMTYNVTI